MNPIYHLIALPLFSCIWLFCCCKRRPQRKYRGKTQKDVLNDRILQNKAEKLLSSIQKIERIKTIHHQLLHSEKESYVMEYRKEIIDMCLASLSQLLHEEHCDETQDELVAIQKDFYALFQPPFL